MAHPGDAFGEALVEFLDGRGPGAHVIERDDGFVEGFASVEPYFGGTDGYAPIEQEALRLIGEKVLDIGAGAGRFALAAQASGPTWSPSTIPPVRSRSAGDVAWCGSSTTRFIASSPGSVSALF